MGSRQTPHQVLAEARQIASANNMFVIERADKGVQVHILYRRLPMGRSERLGKSRSPDGFRRLVKNCAVAK